MSAACLHCGNTKRREHRRGLCCMCYGDRSIRALYAPLLTGPKRGRRDEPTAEELERTIAEQLANLPDWWDEEYDREREREYAPKVCRVVRCL